jgi:hypothetical protein
MLSGIMAASSHRTKGRQSVGVPVVELLEDLRTTAVGVILSPELISPSSFDHFSGGG